MITMAEEEDRDIYVVPCPTAGQNTAETPLLGGRRKTFAGLQRCEWAFVIVSILNILLTLVLTIYRLIDRLEHDDEQSSFAQSPDFTFALLIIINSGFCLIYVINGVLREREFELYALTAAILVILVYCVIEFSVNSAPSSNGRTRIKLARLIAVCLLAPINIGLSIYVARDFGWLEFKIVGASEALQMMYRDATRLSSLLKFEVQLSCSLVLLVLWDGTNVTTVEIVILALGIPLCIIIGIIGLVSVRYEVRWLVGVFYLVSLSLPAYIIYKLVESIKELRHKHNQDEKVIWITVIGAGFLGLILQGIIFFEMARCFNNFGKGLKERAFEAEGNERTSLLVRHRRR